MRLMRYILGGIVIGSIVVGILFFDNFFRVLSPIGISYQWLFKRGLGILFLSAVFCLIRIFRGPTPSDRIVSIDMLGILIIGICSLLSIVTHRSWYIDIGIAWALQSFISTLALAKFLEEKNLDE